ncbi:MAG: tRNA (guanosine(37)-N1)-methyltransferase TrmD, partial [Oscillospiraceae bacterium]
PQGKTLTQEKCVSLSKMKNIFILCGHYEGVDERLIEEIVDEEISIGDYVLTGGELPALVLCDAVARMCEGVLSDKACYEEESHFNGLLEYPQYTRPEEWRGRKVPPVLLSGHDKNIQDFRKEQSYLRTLKKRPDMIEKLEKQKGKGENNEI